MLFLLPGVTLPSFLYLSGSCLAFKTHFKHQSFGKTPGGISPSFFWALLAPAHPPSPEYPTIWPVSLDYRPQISMAETMSCLSPRSQCSAQSLAWRACGCPLAISWRYSGKARVHLDRAGELISALVLQVLGDMVGKT